MRDWIEKLIVILLVTIEEDLMPSSDARPGASVL